MNKLPNLEAHKENYEQGKSIASFIKFLSNWPLLTQNDKKLLRKQLLQSLGTRGAEGRSRVVKGVDSC